jgi:hypothetical protein
MCQRHFFRAVSPRQASSPIDHRARGLQRRQLGATLGHCHHHSKGTQIQAYLLGCAGTNRHGVKECKSPTVKG